MKDIPEDFPDMSDEEANKFLKREGYDPDELAKHGVEFVRMTSLVAKIKNVVFGLHGHKTGYEILEEVKELLRQYEKETKDKDAPLHNEGEAADNDV